jgi:hypothetical protein
MFGTMIPKLNASIKTKKIKSGNTYSKLAYTYFPDPFTKMLHTPSFMPVYCLCRTITCSTKLYYSPDGNSSFAIAEHENHCISYGIIHLHPEVTMDAAVMELNSGVICVTHKQN